MSGFPWRPIMALGLGRLGLAPREFWAATPREIAAALGATAATAPMPRERLDDLLQRFPDGT